MPRQDKGEKTMIEYSDPFNRLIKIAQKKLSISDKITIQFHPEISVNGEPPFGETIEESACSYVINIAATLPVFAAVEIMAHELAHVIAGIDNEHNDIWDSIFSDLQKEFEETQIEELKAAR